jgi:hypothetical protein
VRLSRDMTVLFVNCFCHHELITTSSTCIV